MALWDEILHTASFDGVEFPVASRSISGGRAFARKRYPNRPGQAIEDTGREPYSFELQIPLFAGVAPELYPGTFEQLRFACDSEETGGEAEYVDPELGPIRARVVGPWEWKADAGRRDGGIFTLRLEEVSHDDIVISTGRADDPRDRGDAVDEALEDLGVSEEELVEDFGRAGLPLTEDEKDFEQGELWSTQASRFLEGLEDGITSAEEIADRVDTIRARIDLMLSREELQAPRATYAHHAAVRFAASLQAAADAAVRERPPLVEHVIATELSVYELSTQLYGTPDRANEILQRNPSANPLFFPAGSRFVVLAADRRRRAA